ncbi:hypothetical protein K505DRAFT_329495 [Melanomma pulvis-pyrius CBS 109.77]|uniref:Uncharacterized protein n=1 Tax=Melanomma pulvis-pyrius CBS 109.77 TaxID=1314802 RepID=A0A6A6WU12_9PLEO|nr:hypothetical protein K505DRAFT_329495 [Melanomma pulvis-pyrius CBS 109.77]
MPHHARAQHPPSAKSPASIRKSIRRPPSPVEFTARKQKPSVCHRQADRVHNHGFVAAAFDSPC